MKQHTLHFIILAVLLAVGIVGFFLTRGNTQLQLTIGILTSFSYTVWGILHHALENDLHPKVVIEYVLIGAIAAVLLLLLLGA